MNWRFCFHPVLEKMCQFPGLFCFKWGAFCLLNGCFSPVSAAFIIAVFVFSFHKLYLTDSTYIALGLFRLVFPQLLTSVDLHLLTIWATSSHYFLNHVLIFIFYFLKFFLCMYVDVCRCACAVANACGIVPHTPPHTLCVTGSVCLLLCQQARWPEASRAFLVATSCLAIRTVGL